MDSMISPIEGCLDPGERLLWSGQSKQGVRLQSRDIFLIPFSLMWGGFAIFWEAMALGIGRNVHQAGHGHPDDMVASLIMPLFGLPFVTIGLYLIFGRFFYDAAVRKKTWYGITNQRVIIFKSLWTRNIASFDCNHLPALNLVERSDGSGDILLGNPLPMAAFAGSGGWPGTGRYAVPGFYLISDARSVYNQIREAQRQTK